MGWLPDNYKEPDEDYFLSDQQKRMVKKNFCEICLSHEDEIKGVAKLEIHVVKEVIDEEPHNDNFINLWTLCQTCHEVVHSIRRTTDQAIRLKWKRENATR